MILIPAKNIDVIALISNNDNYLACIFKQSEVLISLL